MKRKLTTIVAADVAGYSRLVGADEEQTLSALRAHRSELIDPLLKSHGGRIANTAGDSLLVEFPSAVEALRAVNLLQEKMAERNADTPEDKRIQFRIGVNIGDVISEGTDLLGDGVNIAARLEALAPPGGIVLSRSVRDQVRDRMDVNLADLGEIEVKNIARPVRAFQVLGDNERPLKLSKPGKLRTNVVAAGAVLLMVVAGIWWYLQSPQYIPADPAKMAYALDDKPSIAVLAFNNLTGDEQQENVSDGISEDIISLLAQLPGVLVIARNSSFSYKGKQVEIRQIAEEQSVRYVLEGSLQRSDETLRITAQLIDAVTGRYVWARTYDRPRQDLFKIRDEITRNIIAELNSELVESDIYWSAADTFKSVDTWLLARRSIAHHRRWNAADNQIAIDLLNKIMQQEPGSPITHANLAFVHAAAARLGWSDNKEKSLALSEMHADQAIALDENFSGGYIAKAWVRLVQGRVSEGIALAEKALERTPGDASILGIAAILYQKDMQADRAIALFDRATRINSRARGWVWENYAEALQIAGRYEESIPIFKRGLKFAQGFITTEIYIGLAVTYDALDRQEEGRAAIEAAVKATPSITLDYMRKFQRYKDQAYKQRWIAALARMGLSAG